MEKVLRDLELLAERGKITGFLNNVKDADALIGLADDIRDAMMGYQVRSFTAPAWIVPEVSQDCAAARHLSQELPAHREGSDSMSFPRTNS